MTLTLKIRERNRDLVRQVKRLEKANTALGLRLRLEDMDSEALGLMVEDDFQFRLELDKIDWKNIFKHHATDFQFSFKYRVVIGGAYVLAIPFAFMRAGPPLVVTGTELGLSSASSASQSGELKSSTVPPRHSSPVSTPPAPPASSGKTNRRRNASDDEDVDFGGGDSGEDVLGEGPPAKKTQPSPKSLSSNSSASAATRGKSGSVPKKLDVEMSDVESMSSPRLTPKRKAAVSYEFRSPFRLAGGSRSDIKSLATETSTDKSTKTPSSKTKKSRSKKTATKPAPGYLSSDEFVISVSFSSEYESSSDSDFSAWEGSAAQEDEDNELSKLRPEPQCLEDSLDDILDTPVSQDPSTKTFRASEKTSPKSKARYLPVAKADVKPSPKGKKKASPKSAAKNKSSAKPKKSTASKKKPKSSPKKAISSKKVKSRDVIDDSLLDTDLPDWISKSPKLKCWVKLEQSFLPSPVPSNTEVKCTTISIAKFSNFVAADHPWRKQCSNELTTRSSCVVSDAGYGDKKSAVMSFAIYERKHGFSPEAVKRFFSHMTARLGKIKDTKERLRFKLALEHLKKCVGPDSPLPIVTLLDTTPPFYTMENLMWVPGPADWCAKAGLVDISEPCRADWLASPVQRGDIDSSWDRAFRGVDENEEMEEGEAGEDDPSNAALPESPVPSAADSVATMDLDRDSADDASAGPRDEKTDVALILPFEESSQSPKSGVTTEI
ncbi:hypothetical protein PHMEG_00013854 [Phytophthora megakarya]|uniref:Uncharacterized protein n=1 Tax=Phytophthora megakarya TaxID=4795 RepID=A0A225W594_9STRA|nr:hypothetical protein PHMEG_00013854 [Phytophthora megakarya]